MRGYKLQTTWLYCAARCFIIASLAAKSLAEIKSSCIDDPAEVLISRHAKLVKAKWQQLSNSRSEAPPAVQNEDIEATNFGEKLQCLTQFEYTPQSNQVQVKVQLAGKGSCKAVAVRDEIVLLVLNHVLATHNKKKILQQNFTFWMDMTDASVLSKASYRLLSFPVLSFGVGADNPYALPIPELMMLLGIIGSESTLLKAVKGAAPPLKHHEALAMEMAALYSYKKPDTTAWIDKLPAALFHASCFPTFNPKGYVKDSEGILYLRGDVCRAARSAPAAQQGLLHVGLKMTKDVLEGCDDAAPFRKRLCDGCIGCQNHTAIAQQDAFKYKYLVSVDGYGPAFAAIYQKLSSHSVTLLLGQQPGLDTSKWKPLYHQWFMPLLEAHTHFLPVTADTIHSTVQWCIGNDPDCELIAARAASTMKCSVTLESAQLYLFKALQLVHDTQTPDLLGYKEPLESDTSSHDPRWERLQRMKEVELERRAAPAATMMVDKRRAYIEAMKAKAAGKQQNKATGSKASQVQAREEALHEAARQHAATQKQLDQQRNAGNAGDTSQGESAAHAANQAATADAQVEKATGIQQLAAILVQEERQHKMKQQAAAPEQQQSSG